MTVSTRNIRDQDNDIEMRAEETQAVTLNDEAKALQEIIEEYNAQFDTLYSLAMTVQPGWRNGRKQDFVGYNDLLLRHDLVKLRYDTVKRVYVLYKESSNLACLEFLGKINTDKTMNESDQVRAYPGLVICFALLDDDDQLAEDLSKQLGVTFDDVLQHCIDDYLQDGIYSNNYLDPESAFKIVDKLINKMNKLSEASIQKILGAGIILSNSHESLPKAEILWLALLKRYSNLLNEKHIASLIDNLFELYRNKDKSFLDTDTFKWLEQRFPNQVNKIMRDEDRLCRFIKRANNFEVIGQLNQKYHIPVTMDYIHYMITKLSDGDRLFLFEMLAKYHHDEFGKYLRKMGQNIFKFINNPEELVFLVNKYGLDLLNVNNIIIDKHDVRCWFSTENTSNPGNWYNPLNDFYLGKMTAILQLINKYQAEFKSTEFQDNQSSIFYTTIKDALRKALLDPNNATKNYESLLHKVRSAFKKAEPNSIDYLLCESLVTDKYFACDFSPSQLVKEYQQLKQNIYAFKFASDLGSVKPMEVESDDAQEDPFFKPHRFELIAKEGCKKLNELPKSSQESDSWLTRLVNFGS